MSQGKLLDRTGLQLLATPSRTVWLGVDCDNLMIRIEQGLQMAGSEIRRAGENNTKRCGHGVSCQALAARACFSSFFLMRSRFNGDR